ncbi:hypothetical protein [Algiphilus sp.]|uniref:hypothetical protein n=1 Tax=Algiphilus sp. TaxID=1872431 RepID=UPI003BA9BA97
MTWDWTERLRIGAAVSYSPQNRVTAVNGLSNVRLQLARDAQNDPTAPAGLVAVAVDEDPGDQRVENRFEILQVQIGVSWRPR